MDLSELGRNTFLIIMGCIALFIAGCLLLERRAKRRKKREIAAGKAKWVRAILRAEREGFQAVLAVDGTPKTRLVEPYSETELKAVAVYLNAEKDRRDAELRDQYFDADQPVYALEALVLAIGDHRDLSKLFGLISYNEVTNRVNELRAEQLIRCRNGDKWSVGAYREFVRFAAGDKWNSRMYEVFGIDKPDLPIDWDGLVLDANTSYSMSDLSGEYKNMRQVTDAAAELLEPADSASLSRLKNLLAYAYLFDAGSAVALELKRAIVRIKNG